MNNNKLKQIVASSLVALAGASCTTAPAPWADGQGGAAKGSVAHSHNGVVHTHPLPSAGIHHSHRQGGTPAATNTQSGNGVSHSHNGKTHSHPLPSSGIQHTHSGGQSGTTGGNSGSQAQTSAYDYGSYDYGTSNSGSNSGSRSDAGYYDSEYPRSSDSRDDYRYDDSGYGRGGSSRSPSDSSRDYGTYGDSTSSSSSSSRSTSDSDYYTVRPKDTVFEVMRQTGAYWKDIIRLNDLKAPKYEIQPGQRLRLPAERNS